MRLSGDGGTGGTMMRLEPAAACNTPASFEAAGAHGKYGKLPLFCQVPAGCGSLTSITLTLGTLSRRMDVPANQYCGKEVHRTLMQCQVAKGDDT